MRGSRAKATTLIEVIAAILLLGMAITTMLVAQSRTLARISNGKRELKAVHLAKELRAAWKLNDQDLAQPASGSVDDAPGWSWQRSAQPVRVADSIVVTEVALEIMYSQGLQSQPWSRRFGWLIVKGGVQ